RVRYAEHLPGPGLAAHVACFWSVACDQAGANRVLPDGCMDLLFDANTGSAALVGTMTGALLVPHAPRARIFGVRFRPGEAFGFGGAAAADARAASVPLADAWGRRAAELAARLAEAAGDRERMALLERELLGLRRRPPDPRVRRAVARIVAAPTEVRVA